MMLLIDYAHFPLFLLITILLLLLFLINNIRKRIAEKKIERVFKIMALRKERRKSDPYWEEENYKGTTTSHWIGRGHESGSSYSASQREPFEELSAEISNLKWIYFLAHTIFMSLLIGYTFILIGQIKQKNAIVCRNKGEDDDEHITYTIHENSTGSKKILFEVRIALNIPDTMALGESCDGICTASLSTEDTVLYHGLNVEEFTEERKQLPNKIFVKLVDLGHEYFEIDSMNSAEQIITSNTNTVWKWRIRPIRAGDACLYGIVRSAVDDVVIPDQTETKKVHITSTAFSEVKNYFGNDNFKYLITLFIGFLGWLSTTFFKKKPKIDNGKYV